MTTPRARTPPPLGRRLTLETPEQVQFAVELAGIGSRTLAIFVDFVIIFVLMVLAVTAGSLAIAGTGLAEWINAILLGITFTILWGYFALSEGLFGGRTLGKHLVGLRVVMDTGHPVTFTAAVIRNLVRIVDLQPAVSGLVGLLFVFFHPHAKRLGDLVAGTIVVRGAPETVTFDDERAAPQADVELAATLRLSDREFRVLEGYMARARKLSRARHRELQADLLRRFADRFPELIARSDRFLQEVLRIERQARRSPVAARRSASGRVRAAGTAERFVALRRDAWNAFRRQVTEIERRGLKNLTGAEVMAFSSGYRAVAADLARARTYRADPRVLRELERLVAAGHHALYGLRGVRRVPFGRLLLGNLPAAVYRARRTVLVAATLFVAPAAAGWLVVYNQPTVARRILPATMLDRAERGVQQREAGVGYAETPDPFLPVVASSIIANNVQVAFSAFAFGITAGVGTVFVLVLNGLFFGAVFALFENYGLLGWLLTFVAGHGVLELTAIFIAGAGGLMVGGALVAPGDLARRDALVLAGREALHLVGAAVSLLLLAGTIEGFLSASDAAPALKIGVSAVTMLLTVLYFLAGKRYATSNPVPYMTTSPASKPLVVSGVQSG